MYLYNIGCIRKYLTMEATKTLVHAFVMSQLDYANSLLYGLPKHMIQKLQYIQNNAARIITRTQRREHITPILKRLHWLPVEQRIKHKILSIVYKALHGLTPNYLAELIHTYQPNRTLRSEQESLLWPGQRTHSHYGERTFTYAAANLWNNLPKDIRQKDTLQSFQKNLKHHLFSEHYTSSESTN